MAPTINQLLTQSYSSTMRIFARLMPALVLLSLSVTAVQLMNIEPVNDIYIGIGVAGCITAFFTYFALTYLTYFSVNEGAARVSFFKFILINVLVVLLVVLGIVALIVPGIIIAIRTYQAPYNYLKGMQIGEAIKTSWHNTRGYGWRIFGYTLAGSLVAGIVTGVISLPFMLGSTVATEAGMTYLSLVFDLGSNFIGSIQIIFVFLYMYYLVRDMSNPA